MNITTNRSIKLLMLITFTFMSITASNASMPVACDMSGTQVSAVSPGSDENIANNHPCHNTDAQATVGTGNCCDNSQCACFSLLQTTIQSGLQVRTSIWLTENLLIYSVHQLPEIYIPSNYRPPIA